MSADVPANAIKKRVKRDYRKMALGLMFVATLILGYLINLMPGRSVSAVTPAETKVAVAELKAADLSSLKPVPAKVEIAVEQLVPEPAKVEKNVDPKTSETNRILNDATKKIRAKRFDDAISDLQQVREKIQQSPQSYVVMASALAGKKDYDTARDFYKTAIDKDPMLAEAYFGFAVTSEALGDLPAAIGGMRNFLHVQPNADPQKLKIVQARSAIWEWESQIGRGPWGPTKGVPPDFTAEQIKRDDRGVGIKMQIPGTKQADGTSKYEIKAQDKFQIFKP
ncbi:MAG: tetratricopeptide repeat protein [Polaromonas sp.]